MTNKTWKIITSCLVALIIGLVCYAMIVQPKVKAGQEYMDKMDRIEELRGIIEGASNSYKEAIENKEACIVHWDEKMVEEHEKAENARKEIEEIKSFIMSR